MSSRTQSKGYTCASSRTQTSTSVDPPAAPAGWFRRTLNALALREAVRRRRSDDDGREESIRERRAAELRHVLRLLEGPASFHDDPGRDVIDCIARVGLAICRAGGDHLGDVHSIHEDFIRLVRLAVHGE